jgi:hypothetical protein
MLERGKPFLGEKWICHDLEPILNAHGAFFIGGLAIGFQYGNLSYRPTDDIDVICPLQSHGPLVNDIAEAAGNYPIFYNPGNQVIVLNIGPQRLPVELHMTAYEERSDEYIFPFDLQISKPFPLSDTFPLLHRMIQIASVDLLLAMKRHAIKSHLIYPSDLSKYQRDIEILEGIKK